ncbi:MAG: hypothetical protein ACYC6S_07305 [Desulfobulbia bacterium]
MKDLLEKLSSYNIFNYLLPGIVFVALCEALTTFSFVQKDIVLGVFLYYFIGLVISRIGSLIIEPSLKYIKFVQYAKYENFVSASNEDDKLEVLSEVNNMYRTFCSLFLVLSLLKIYEKISSYFPGVSSWNIEILIVFFLILFCLSYRKQTEYITKRVNKLTSKG